jgi:hypothetical protein
MIRQGVLRACALVLLCGVLLAGCSSTSSTSTTSPAETADTGSMSPPASSPASGGNSTATLDGTWQGSWKDAANATGTFSVDFTQTGSSLKGTLSISLACLDGAKVTGTVNGDSIEFGSVQGQCQVDYKGSINGDQMSGTYDFSGQQGGTWEASKA